jgi:hypothetical protein
MNTYEYSDTSPLLGECIDDLLTNFYQNPKLKINQAIFHWSTFVKDHNSKTWCWNPNKFKFLSNFI